jgi:hypothetical protein
MVIEFTPGTVFNQKDLREFDLEKALQGHPLACLYDEQPVSVQAVRRLSEYSLGFDYWHPQLGCWQTAQGLPNMLAQHLRLAPLAEKDGRPLHVGDQIEVFHKDWFRWAKVAMNFDNPELLTANGDWQWRWPESKE